MPVKRVVLSHEAIASAAGDRWPAAELKTAAELLAGSEGRFPAGVRALSSDLVSVLQRERLIIAMLRAVAEVGYPDVRVQDVLSRAGVSRPTFYEHFENRDACLHAALEESATRLLDRVESAAGTVGGGSEDGRGDGSDETDWRPRLRAGVAELLGFLDGAPDVAIALVVETRGSTPEGLRRHEDLAAHFATCIDALVHSKPAASPSPVAAGIVGAIDGLLYARLAAAPAGVALQPGEANLGALLPSIMQFATLFYAGPEAAA